MRRVAVIFSTLIFAFAILLISVLRSASVRYAFSPMVLSDTRVVNEVDVDYEFVYPGKIMPDSPLWYLKAARDKIWLYLTPNSAKKAELLLLFADKRLMMAKILFEKEKYDLGFSTLSKAEKYLAESVVRGSQNPEVLQKIALASLKHREVIEEDILPHAPEDAKAEIVKLLDLPKETYVSAKNSLLKIGNIPCENPFESE